MAKRYERCVAIGDSSTEGLDDPDGPQALPRMPPNAALDERSLNDCFDPGRASPCSEIPSSGARSSEELVSASALSTTGREWWATLDSNQ